MRRPVVLLVALCVAGPLSTFAVAQDPATFYEDNCASCHTIGGGAQGGPDLKGVTARRDREWLIKFLLDPEAFASDPAVVQMVKEAEGLAMGPTEGLTRGLAESIIALIDRRSATPGNGSSADTAVPFTAEDVATGRALFTGASRLHAGGPACVACHGGGDLPLARSGRLGPDLLDVHGRLGGARGVTAWLGATQTPMMRALYKDARISPEEARALAAFLGSTRATSQARRASAPHVLGGVTGGLLVLGAVGLVWANRFTAVRRPMVGRKGGQRTGGSR